MVVHREHLQRVVIQGYQVSAGIGGDREDRVRHFQADFLDLMNVAIKVMLHVRPGVVEHLQITLRASGP